MRLSFVISTSARGQIRRASNWPVIIIIRLHIDDISILVTSVVKVLRHNRWYIMRGETLKWREKKLISDANLSKPTLNSREPLNNY